MTTRLEPLVTERRIVSPLWGGTRLAGWLGLPTPHTDRIGEVWQVYDDNRVVEGEMAGRTLAEATVAWGVDLVGTRSFDRYGPDFPLLVKFLDTAAPLSVQVHPDDDYAHSREATTGFHGKTEAWYVIDAASDATIVHGLTRKASRAEVEAAIEAEDIEPLLARFAVSPGDAFLVPAGTIHTIGAGILLYEVQQKSDLTYRVFDFGRRDPVTSLPRRLHVDKALDVAHLGPSDSPRRSLGAASDGRQLVVSCREFALERWTPTGTEACQTDPVTVEILTVVEGRLDLLWDAGVLNLARGDSVVLPAALGRYQVAATDAARRPVVLRAFVPDSR
jgi:mannose-6-phosphate isomerase